MIKLTIVIISTFLLHFTTLASPVTKCDASSLFNLTLIKAVGTPKADFDNLFEEAADRIRCIIQSNHSLEITYNVTSIDGPGGLIGYATLSDVDENTFLATQSMMKFDLDDLNQTDLSSESETAEDVVSLDVLKDTILHEMIHALGFGSGWQLVLSNSTKQPTNLTKYGCIGANETDEEMFLFLGPKAAKVYNKLGFEGNLTVENGNGEGSKCVHWDEEIIPFELMTPIVNPGGVNVLSELTLASLEDMGWTVDYNQAEELTIENSGACFMQNYLSNEFFEKIPLTDASGQNRTNMVIKKDFQACFDANIKYPQCESYINELKDIRDRIDGELASSQ